MLLKYDDNDKQEEGVVTPKKKKKIKSRLVVSNTGRNSFPELMEYLDEDEIYYGYFKLTEGHSVFAFLTYVGEKVPLFRASRVSVHKHLVCSTLFTSYAFEIHASSKEDLRIAYIAKAKQVILIHKHSRTITMEPTNYNANPIEITPPLVEQEHHQPQEPQLRLEPIPRSNSDMISKVEKLQFLKQLSAKNEVSGLKKSPRKKQLLRVWKSGEDVQDPIILAQQQQILQQQLKKVNSQLFSSNIHAIDFKSSMDDSLELKRVSVGMCVSPTNSAMASPKSPFKIKAKIHGVERNASLFCLFYGEEDCNCSGPVQTQIVKSLQQQVDEKEIFRCANQNVLETFENRTSRFCSPSLATIMLFDDMILISLVGNSLVASTVVLQKGSSSTENSAFEIVEMSSTTKTTSVDYSSKEFFVIVTTNDIWRAVIEDPNNVRYLYSFFPSANVHGLAQWLAGHQTSFSPSLLKSSSSSSLVSSSSNSSLSSCCYQPSVLVLGVFGDTAFVVR